MSWLFSRALVEEFSAATCWDGAPSAPLSVMPTEHKFWRNDKTMEPCQLSRFGLTCAVLTESRGAELLTWFRAGFPAKTSATAVRRKASRASAVASGKKWPGSFARFNRDTRTWKTSQRCLFEELTSCSVTWPRWGSMHDGECWELPTLAVTRPAKGYGLWPTLKASDGEQRTSNLDYFKRRLGISPDLPVIVALSTPPTTKGFYGRLNPDWCEWLTTWPIRWTALEPLAMDRIHAWQQRHSHCFPIDTN